MKTRTAQLATITIAVTMAVALFTLPAIISARSSPSTNSQPLSSATTPLATGYHGPLSNGERGGRFQFQSAVSLSVGQTITISSTQGKYYVFGTPSKNGTSSGTLTFTVTAKLSRGYALSLTSGSIVVDGATYTVSSGSAQMRLYANAMVGQGTTTPTGQFLFQAQARGSFAGTTGLVSLDFTNGTTEYAVALTGTIKS